MNLLLMITACLVLIGTVWAKKGYLVDRETGCKYDCLISGPSRYCESECKSKNHGGGCGYCRQNYCIKGYCFACWCAGLPESTPTWPLPNKSCSTKYLPEYREDKKIEKTSFTLYQLIYCENY
ncbi:beta-toxin Cn5-like [Centruroides sculpturatus]|uniref:beta-toxin Cn5-like n=1 Tax=Centruroides sculpturatus TaxID=218467 RepID=UPI000C6DE1DD|nr:beta-toxin Cn5-like [Centruroides sculpturatus]